MFGIDVDVPLIVSIGVIAFLLFMGTRCFRIVKQHERGLVERMGRYLKTVDSGLVIIRPFFDRLVKIDMREQVVDIEPQDVITKDNVLVKVDAVIYFEVTDPSKVEYNVGNFYAAVTKLAQTTLRNIVGDLSLDETLTSRDKVNTKLRQILDDATDKWGVKITRVEIKEITPPHEIHEAMTKQMRAERSKRATILDAEASKEAQVLVADGEKGAKIKQAEGDRESRMIRAKGESEAIKMIANAEAEAIKSVYSAIHEGGPTNDLLAIKYMEALKEIAKGDANKVFIPYEATGVMASVATIGDLFTEGQGQKQIKKKKVGEKAKIEEKAEDKA